ncbi:MAG: response regulator [Proteobacteria bacterium]|nr:response regulator [Desulfobacteraceae bacterium]MBU0733779.1 response regulator [Pseudomonadota bacterium]MBU0988566.1 response regulator [Pseudomonadota bacterium]MBU1903409.1 response regulator [Pseudomonadota bacterium]
MDPKKIISGKRVLVVDDEQDVLDTLAGLLDMCKIDTATTFEEGRRLLENNVYDVAILDIMGVKGFNLLEIANKRGVPALMLTAHALSGENLKKSAENGASYYAPKDKIDMIDVFVADVLEAKQKNKSAWIKMFERLGSFYDRKFGGPDWREKEKEFWEKRTKTLR